MHKNIILIIFAAFMLCSAGFCNKFPLVTTETGSYINSGFTRTLAHDSTIFYGLFIAHFSWGLTLWLVIFGQSLIVSIILYYYFKYLSGSAAFQLLYLLCVFFVTGFTSAPVTASTIGPGVFAAVSVLSAGLLLSASNVNKIDHSIITVIAVVSICMDTSYLFAILVIVLGYCVLILVQGRIRLSSYSGAGLRRAIVAMAVIGVSFLLICSSNALFNRIFGLCAGGDAFAANRLRTAVNAFPSGITSLDISGYKSTSEATETFKAVFKWYDWEGREFVITRQFQSWLTFQYLNYAQLAAVLVSCMVFLVAIRAQSRSKPLFFYLFLSVMAMVFVDLFFYGGSHRMTGQLIWLLLVPSIVFISEIYPRKKKYAAN